MKNFVYLFLILFLTIFTTACSTTKETSSSKDYGVFLSIDASEIDKLSRYKTVVIDVQFSSYDFDTSSFGINGTEEKAYFSDYIESCQADGMEVYLLEYTTDRNLITQIETYCKEKGFHYYISDSI